MAFTSAWLWHAVAADAVVLGAIAFAAILIWPDVLARNHQYVFLWITIPANLTVLASYVFIMVLKDAENGLAVAKQGLYQAEVSVCGAKVPAKRLCDAFWLVVAAAYSYLYCLCAYNADNLGNDFFRLAFGVFTIFPLSATAWSLAVWDDSVETNGTSSVLCTAAFSLAFILLGGRCSENYRWLQWLAVLTIVFQHVVIDGIVWTRMLNQKTPIGIHGRAAMLHIASAIIIYIYGMEKADYNTALYKFPVVLDRVSDFRPLVWEYTCANNASSSSCDDDDKNFRIKDRYAFTTYVHVLALTAAFAVWSGMCHVVASRTTPDVARMIKWIDYAGSAPMMLVVISLQYGHYRLMGIVLAPALLGLLILWAGVRREFKDTFTTTSNFTWFAFVIILYAATWFPSGYSFNDAFKHEKEPVLFPNGTVEASGIGKPPDFIWGFYAFTVAVFSSFPVVYGLQLINVIVNPGTEEKTYIGLSLIAKLILHLFVGLTVISTAGMLDETQTSTERTLLPGVLGAFCIVVGVSIWLCFFADTSELTKQAATYTIKYDTELRVYQGFKNFA